MENEKDIDKWLMGFAAVLHWTFIIILSSFICGSVGYISYSCVIELGYLWLLAFIPVFIFMLASGAFLIFLIILLFSEMKKDVDDCCKKNTKSER